jgi:penicillin-binding protein-related factor A (putative recombinase)
MGKKSKSVGDKFESYIEGDNKWLHAQGRATVFKVPTPVRIKGARGRKTWGVKGSKVWVDFSGFLHPIGLAINFDAKTQKGDRFDLGLSKKSNRFQYETLVEIAAGGALAFYFAEHRHGPRNVRRSHYIFPVTADGGVAGRTDRKSVRWDAAQEFKIGLQQKWLDKLIELYSLDQFAPSLDCADLVRNLRGL